MQRAVVYGVARGTERVGNESGRDDQLGEGYPREFEQERQVGQKDNCYNGD